MTISYDLFWALIAFAFVSSVTPGPNNMMLLASGANFGFRRTLPHMLGIGIGFTVMILLVGVGLIGVFDTFPLTYDILKAASLGYMIWLAWKIANASLPATDDSQTTSVPFTFLQAALFQWVNPKAWTMGLGAIALYAPDRSLASVALVAGAFGLVNLPAISVWVVLGQQIRHVLSSPRKLRMFNWTMAALLLASMAPVLLG